jgi:hypothetical protein
MLHHARKLGETTAATAKECVITRLSMLSFNRYQRSSLIRFDAEALMEKANITTSPEVFTC